MRVSIATRVSAACTFIIVVSLILLGIGLAVESRIREANHRVEQLVQILQVADRHDHAQQRLRLNIGDVTRMAERQEPVSDSLWARSAQQVAAFERLALSEERMLYAASPRTHDTILKTSAAGRQFAVDSHALLEAAQIDPAAIEYAMPRFLFSLKQLEAARAELRAELTDEVRIAAMENRKESGRDIMHVLVASLILVLIVFGLMLWLRRRLIGPIAAISARLREINDGTITGSIPELRRQDELGDLARALQEFHAAVERRRTAERRADFLAHHDMLTGLANRLQFEARLAEDLARAVKTGEQVAVFAIDMDDFKAINDRLGHPGGDRALQRAGQLLLGIADEHCLVARLGGDEFAIVQTAADQPDAAAQMLARLYEACAQTANEEAAIRMSVGVAIAAQGQSGEEVHQLADLALYQAKAEGRNTGRFFDARLEERERLRMRLARDMEGALANGEFHLAFQPIAEARSLRVVGYEALLRWRHPSLGEISPEAFIPIAESNGMIGAIGLWAAEKAFSAAAGWDNALTLSLNLSPIQFRKPGLATDLATRAVLRGVTINRLAFEMTESAALLGSNRDEVLRELRLLQSFGAQIVLDDFGTGHSSLSNLKDFPFDKLKIDRSFVAAMLRDHASASIVKATIGLGKSMGLTIVAEGVEQESELEQLRRWGCEEVQGYLIGRPAAETLPQPVALLRANGL